MEIMKIFSSYDDYGYEDERLYSVLLSEDELYLFSELQKEFSSKAQKELRRKWELGEAEKMGLKTTKPNGKIIGGSIQRVRERNNNFNIDKLSQRQDWLQREEKIGSRSKHWIKQDMKRNLSPENRAKLAENNAARIAATQVVNPQVPKTPAPKLGTVKPSMSKTGGAMNLLKKNKKALKIGGGLAAAGGLATVGGIGYGIYKSRQNKEKE